MKSNVKVKICGLTTSDTVKAAIAADTDYIGFVFFAKSPRYVTPKGSMKLAEFVPEKVIKVGLVVDADDALLDDIMSNGAIDMLQLQGKEPPERVAKIKATTGLPVMKAVGIFEKSDLDILDDYIEIADQLLIDAKPPKGAKLPGGNGLPFDWTILNEVTISAPWMLAGGLTADNVAQALSVTSASQVDVSSAVEHRLGEKDPYKIRTFIEKAKSSTL